MSKDSKCKIPSNEDEGRNVKSTPIWFSSRQSLAIIGFFGFVNLYAQRVNMSVAVVCMVNNTALQHQMSGENVSGEQKNSSSGGECSIYESNSTSHDREGEFAWDKETQGLILSSFFWGYIVTQIPGGWLAEKFGGRRVFGYSMLLCALATLATPLGARADYRILMTLRFIKGLGQGVVFPSMHSIWSHWAPPLERTKLVAFTYAGAQIGNVITFPLSALLCDYGFDNGWGSIFYIFGILGVIWFIAWMIIARDSPAEHPRISKDERDYIENALGQATMKSLRERKNKDSKTPWLIIFTSLPCWAGFLAHTFANWETYTLLTNIPSYMKDVLKLDIKSNGLYSAIPYIGYWVFINSGGMIADFLRSRRYMSTRNVRKLFQLLSMTISGAFLIATGYIDCHNSTAAIALLILAVSFSGWQYAGFIVNQVDIAPNYAGILFGISNTLATLSGIFAPYAIGLLTKNSTQEEWQTVFYLAAGICVSGAIFFLIFAKGEIQPWARNKDEEEGTESELSPATESTNL